jgi:hypothetical protein
MVLYTAVIPAGDKLSVGFLKIVSREFGENFATFFTVNLFSS